MDDPVVVASEDSLDRACWASVKMARDQAAAALAGSAMDPTAAIANGRAARRGFVTCAKEEPARAKTPRVSDLRPGLPRPTPPPPHVKNKIGEHRLAIGIDIETAGWDGTQPIRGSWGQFGFYNLCCPADLGSRIVQLGWSVGEMGTDEVTTKERLIKPEGFVVTEQATRVHKITHERAVADGLPLRAVLSEFMDDVLSAYHRGGRVVCHHLEFDAGIIKEELERCGFNQLAEQWAAVARRGFCSMDPELGRWLSTCHGKECGPPTSKITMKLKELVGYLLPGSAKLLQAYHTAGADATLHLQLYFKLQEMARGDGGAVA